MYPLKQSTAITVPFFAHDANGDAVTGLTDGSFTKRISKNGGAFAAMTVTITEQENGWYSIPVSTAHSDTLGILTVVFTNAGAKQVNLQFRVHAQIFDDVAAPGDSMNLAANAVSAAAIATGAIDADALAANTITAAKIATDAITSAKIAAGAITSSEAPNLDAAISTRAAPGDNMGLSANAVSTTSVATGAIDADALATDAVNEIADGILNRDMSVGTDSGSSTVRTVRQALRFLRNRWTSTAGTLTVYKEDDSTTSWTGTLTTDASAEPIVENNPVGGS